MRGSLVSQRHDRRELGSIPACAGEPSLHPARRLWAGVDPRVCGGAHRSGCILPPEKGRSSRVRGSRLLRGRGSLVKRSIPACAGEPYGRRYLQWANRVDPRVCGGATRMKSGAGTEEGRSLRVRGSLVRAVCGGGRLGSIPACAGEPAFRSSPTSSMRVDPRVCGGAALPLAIRRTTRGRSPRVRGSLVAPDDRDQTGGSIPACAGEPQTCQA